MPTASAKWMPYVCIAIKTYRENSTINEIVGPVATIWIVIYLGPGVNGS